MVYVADRENRRIQSFTLVGAFVKQLIKPDTLFARSLALSPCTCGWCDCRQRHRVADRRTGALGYDPAIFDRRLGSSAASEASVKAFATLSNLLGWFGASSIAPRRS
jgi:hypothetical protein